MAVCFGSIFVRCDERSEIRDLHHGVHIPQHDRVVHRELQPNGAHPTHLGRRQQLLHIHIHCRVRDETSGVELAFLQGPMESIRHARSWLVDFGHDLRELDHVFAHDIASRASRQSRPSFA